MDIVVFSIIMCNDFNIEIRDCMHCICFVAMLNYTKLQLPPVSQYIFIHIHIHIFIYFTEIYVRRNIKINFGRRKPFKMTIKIE